MYCTHCGREIQGNAKFCAGCGREIDQVEKITNNMINNTTTTNTNYNENYNVDTNNTNYNENYKVNKNSPITKENKKIIPIVCTVAGVALVAMVGTGLWFASSFIGKNTDNNINNASQNDKVIGNSDSVKNEEQTSNDKVKADEEEKAKKEELARKQAAEEKVERDKLKTRNYYADMLARICMLGKYPHETDDDEYHEFLSQYSEYGCMARYSIIDIDKDGAEELIVSNLNGGCVADFKTYIYKYNPDTEQLDFELACSLFNEYYDNGVIAYTHYRNKTFSEVMPITYFKYNNDADEYEKYVTVTGWDTEFSTEDYDGREFPYDVDKDGDGLVYILTDANGKVEYIDNDEYERWHEKLLAGAKTISVDNNVINVDSLSQYTLPYRQYILKNLKNSKAENVIDIGEIIIDTGDYSAAENEVVSKLNAEIEHNYDEESDCEYEYYYNINGKRILTIWNEDAGGILYDNKVEGLEICGVSPGMDKEVAVAKLRKVGLLIEENYDVDTDYISFSTGNAGPYYGGSLQVENGKVKSVSFYYGYSYAG